MNTHESENKYDSTDSGLRKWVEQSTTHQNELYTLIVTALGVLYGVAFANPASNDLVLLIPFIIIILGMKFQFWNFSIGIANVYLFEKEIKNQKSFQRYIDVFGDKKITFIFDIIPKFLLFIAIPMSVAIIYLITRPSTILDRLINKLVPTLNFSFTLPILKWNFILIHFIFVIFFIACISYASYHYLIERYKRDFWLKRFRIQIELKFFEDYKNLKFNFSLTLINKLKKEVKIKKILLIFNDSTIDPDVGSITLYMNRKGRKKHYSLEAKEILRFILENGYLGLRLRACVVTTEGIEYFSKSLIFNPDSFKGPRDIFEEIDKRDLPFSGRR